MKGTLIKSTGSWFTVRTADNELYACKIRGKFRQAGMEATNPLAVGDHITFEPDETDNTGVITAFDERRNYLIRRSNKQARKYHIIAANIDYVIIMVTVVQPRTPQGFIDRLLLTADAYGIKPLIVFNKIDLYDDEAFLKLDDMYTMYTDLDYECLTISVVEGDHLDTLRERIRAKVCLISGQSAVGKSSLINHFNPDLDLRTNDISSYSGKGKHTTTFAEMHPLFEDTYIIDTPGIKDFGLIGFERQEVARYFRDFRPYMNDCKYNDCLHLDEPGCAVQEALENGDIHPDRYFSYVKLLEDNTQFKKRYKNNASLATKGSRGKRYD